MERVAFIVERTGERIDCLLNPDTVVVRRSAGLRTRRTAGGLVTGTRLADDPLLATGGGRTEIELELLFDATIAGEEALPSGNVQDLTRRLWDLSENAFGDDEYGVPRLVRFVWGKTWNVPALVAAVAERFEQFTTTGVPERSWLHLRLARVGEPIVPQAEAEPLPGEAAARIGTARDPGGPGGPAHLPRGRRQRRRPGRAARRDRGAVLRRTRAVACHRGLQRRRRSAPGPAAAGAPDPADRRRPGARMTLAIRSLPRVTVEGDGGPLRPADAAALAEVVVRQALSAPAQAELTFVDPSPEADLATAFLPGGSLRLRLAEHDQSLFDGEVTAVERVYEPDRGRVIHVRGYDRLHRLRKRGAPTIHLDKTPSALASDLAGAVGLSVDALADGPAETRLAQHRQNDLELLLEVTERNGLYLHVEGDTLRLMSLAGSGETVPLVLGTSLLEASIETERRSGDPDRQRARVGPRPGRGAPGDRRRGADRPDDARRGAARSRRRERRDGTRRRTGTR